MTLLLRSCDCCSNWTVEVLFVLVSMRVFSVFMIAPSCSASSLNLSSSGSTSSNATSALQSST